MTAVGGLVSPTAAASSSSCELPVGYQQLVVCGLRRKYAAAVPGVSGRMEVGPFVLAFQNTKKKL